LKKKEHVLWIILRLQYIMTNVHWTTYTCIVLLLFIITIFVVEYGTIFKMWRYRKYLIRSVYKTSTFVGLRERGSVYVCSVTCVLRLVWTVNRHTLYNNIIICICEKLYFLKMLLLLLYGFHRPKQYDDIRITYIYIYICTCNVCAFIFFVPNCRCGGRGDEQCIILCFNL